MWGREGYNTERIERFSRPADKMHDPVLGTVYRVRLLERGTRGGVGYERSSIAKAKVPAAKAKAAPLANRVGHTPLAIQDGAVGDTDAESGESGSGNSSSNDSDDSTGSTSDSSASSDTGKQRKGSNGNKDKKNKEEQV